MALVVPDSTPVKPQKSKLLQKLEDLQKDQNGEVIGLNFAHRMYDGGLLLLSVLCTITSGTNFGSIARNILSFVFDSGSTKVYFTSVSITIKQFLLSNAKKNYKKLTTEFI